MKASENCFKLIRYYESLHDGDLKKIGLQPKQCPALIWTVGYGHALFFNGKPVKDFSIVEKYFAEFLTIDETRANELLREDVEISENLVNTKTRQDLKQGEFDAIVSHTFNTGGSFNLFYAVRQRQDLNIIKELFLNHYITAGGVKMNGLIKRRKTEFQLYSTGTLNI